MSYTKGPWVAMSDGWVEGADGDPLCMVYGDGLSASPFPEDIPNAHLIAAAPELLEALRDMINYCNAEPGTKAYPGTIAAAAIAKAEGNLK